MPSKKCRLPSEPGKFTRLPSKRIQEIREAARAAAKAHSAGNTALYLRLIHAANLSLSKHETGVFSAFLIAEVGL
jgi:hypothetical protein